MFLSVSPFTPYIDKDTYPSTLAPVHLSLFPRPYTDTFFRKGGCQSYVILKIILDKFFYILYNTKNADF